MSDSIPELKDFTLQGIRRTGVQLGTGSYGDVEELCWNGTKCAGKRLHDCLLDVKSEGSSTVTSKFVSECKIIARIRHPNVVQFLGLCFFKDHTNQNRPVLVMEKLNDNLNNLLDTQPNIQLVVKCSILLDIIRGLVHLHSHNPPIAHRDLTSKNILLTRSMQAKIADLGTARMLISGKSSHKMLHTPMPGTPIFMPPEAAGINTKYDPIKLDVFSFGHIMLHTVTQVLPCDLLPPTYQNSGTDKVRGRTELERRVYYMEILYSQLNKGHVMTKLISSCLADHPKKRPTAVEAMRVIEDYHLELENAGKKCNLYSGISTLITDKTTTVAEKGGNVEGINEIDTGEMRERTISFIDTHILKGHPSVLHIYQAGGGMFRRSGEWREYTFKIADGKLQYWLQHHLQNELPLSKIEYVKGFWSPNSPNMFPFHVHFKGRGSPWILSAHSNEERQSWMEAIKPGSTFNQWVRSDLARPRPKEPSPVPVSSPLPPVPPPRPVATYNPYTLASELFTPEKIAQEGNLDSLRPILRSLLSECPYVPLSELNIPNSRENSIKKPGDAEFGNPGTTTTTTTTTTTATATTSPSPYMQIIGFDSDKDASSVTLEDDIMKELSEQFDPIQVDLLIQMFQAWLSPRDPTDSLPKSRSTARMQPGGPNTLFVNEELVDPLSPRRLGYAKEGRSDPYRCLADIALKLSKIQAERNEKLTTTSGGRREENGEDENRDGIYSSITLLPDHRGGDQSIEDSNEERRESSGMETTSMFTRKNAMRISKCKRQRSLSEGSRSQHNVQVQAVKLRHPKVLVTNCERPVGTLCSLLKQVSTEELLEDNESECPKWSKANAKAVSFYEIPKANRMSLYKKDNEYDLFLSRESLIDFQEIGEGQFGPVYRANRVTENVNVPVALKPIKSRVSSEADISIYLREMSILKCVRHPNIARVYGLVDEANWIVMEYLSNGDLKNYLLYNEPPLSHILKYMLDVSMGMHYLSAKGLVHRKLAARNILVSENEVCKIADLHLGSQKEWMEMEDDAESLNGSGISDPNRSIRWMAPESLLQHRFSTASDVWSYGVVIWEMFNPGKLPHEESDDRVCVERIVNGYLLDVPRDCPEMVTKIMKACWYQNPGSRPSFLYISSLLSNAIIDYK